MITSTSSSSSNLTNTPFGVINILQRIITFAAETPHDVSVRLGSVSRIWYETQECYCSEMWQHFAQNLISKTHQSLNGLSIIERENNNNKIENEKSDEDDAAVTSTTRKQQQQQHIRYTKHIFKMRYAIFVAKFRNKINKDSITFYEREEEVVDANGRSNLFNDIENCGIPDFQFRCPMIAQNLLIPLQKFEFSSTIDKERFEKLKQELEQQQQQNANDDDASSVPTLKPYVNSHQEENNFPLLYCHVCDKNVYSVTNSKQLSEQARKGRCVYISKDHSKIMSLANRTKEQIEGDGIGIRFTRTNYAVITDEPATENGGAAEEFLRRVAFAFGRESQARSEDYLPTFTHFLSREVLFVHPLPKEVNGSSTSLHCFYIVRIPPLKKPGENSEIDTATFLRNHPCHDEFGVLGKSQMPAKGGWSKFVVVNASALRWFLKRDNELPDRVSLTPNLFSSQKQSFVVVRSLMETEGNFFSLGEVEGCQPHKQMHTAMEALISTIVIPLMIPTSLFDPGEIGHIGGIEIEPDVEFDVPPSSDFLTAGGGSDDDDDDVPKMA